MTNAWSLLYDVMTEHSEYYYDTDRNRDPGMKPWGHSDLEYQINLNMNNDPNRYKYDEDAILKELQDLSLIHI